MQLVVRPVRALDRPLVAGFFAMLSDRSRLDRFLAPKPSLSERELDFLSGGDGDARETLVAVDDDGKPAAIAQWVRDAARRDEAEFAIAVADEWQGRRVGTELARETVASACGAGVERLRATISTGNGRARLFRRLGRVVDSRLEGATVDVVVELDC